MSFLRRLLLFLSSLYHYFLRAFWYTCLVLLLLNLPLFCNMDFSLVLFVITIQRFIGLLFTPYKTMRRIAVEGTTKDLSWIYFFSFLYFFLSGNVRMEVGGIIAMILLIFFSVIFFSLLPSSEITSRKFKTVWITWTYTLFPTIIWFYATLVFYLILPPPRTSSFMGGVFSVFYIGFSISLLAWKLILVYLSIRFSLKVHIFRVVYYFLLYIALSVPIWIILYRMGISRIPFI